MAKVIELEGQARFLVDNAGSFSVFDGVANSRRTPLQRLIALGLRPLMLGAAEGKSTHWFDYTELPDPEKYEGLSIQKGSNAFDIGHPNPLMRRIRHVRMSLGGWNDTALIGPDPERVDLAELAETGWLYGFRVRDENGRVLTAQFSQLLNRTHRSTLILRGPRDFEAIGLNPQTMDEVHLAGVYLAKRGTSLQ